MKYIIASVLLAMGLMAQAQQQSDKPPVITVQITAEEKAAIDAASKAVDDAQAALEQAKQKQSSLENKVIQDKRDKLNIPWADCGASPFSSFITIPEHSTTVPGYLVISPDNPDAAKGYTAERRGRWIVFTRGYATCHGV